MKANILGVLIDKLSLGQVLRKTEEFLGDGKKHYIVTPNPEFVMLARQDEEFKNILNQADIAIPDGFGLVLASWWLGDKIPERITGVELVWELARLAEKKNYSLYLLGGKEGIAESAQGKLKEKFPNLRIVGAEVGMSNQEFRIMNYELVERINKVEPDILFVAFGQGKQEKWIYHNLPKLNSVKLAVGVGGTFDYLAGRVFRAPKILRRLGLEWLWRLIVEPWRWKRIITAAILFPLAVLKKKKIIY
jgi:N-acetylglucosaminyldiphosphoundecaprenol N-acetyl-beta-D-mannosaminyltransferase